MSNSTTANISSSEDEFNKPSTSRRARDVDRAETSKKRAVSKNRHSNTPSPSLKRRKPRVSPSVSKKHTLYELFGSDSEDEKAEKRVDKHDGARKGESSSREQKKAVKPTTTDHRGRTSASDIFGSDSDDELMVAAKPGKKSQPISSYFNKRVATGVSRQTDQNKTGTHFIELKVYNCDEIRNVQPMNRWRHAIITIKNQTNENTKAWEHLTQFIKETRKEFKDCRPDILSGCGAYS